MSGRWKMNGVMNRINEFPCWLAIKQFLSGFTVDVITRVYKASRGNSHRIASLILPSGWCHSDEISASVNNGPFGISISIFFWCLLHLQLGCVALSTPRDQVSVHDINKICLKGVVYHVCHHDIITEIEALQCSCACVCVPSCINNYPRLLPSIKQLLIVVHIKVLECI